MAITLPIEKNPELLQRYGLAVALLSTAEYLLGEMVRLNGGLYHANQELVNELMMHRTFGSQIALARKIGIRDELEHLLQPAVEDRNRLAHGVTVEQGDVLKLMHRKGFHDLDKITLDDIIERARALCMEVTKEIQTKFEPTKNPPSDALKLADEDA
jgi:hypothetical protein